MARRSRIKGDFKLRGVLRRIAALDRSDLPRGMAQAADLVLATQQNMIPRDTGEAAAALQVRISRNGLDARIGIIGKRDNRRFYYLKFVEYGTKGYSGTVYRRRDAGAVGGEHTVNRDRSQFSGRNRLGRRATKNKSDGENFFGYYPDIPARPAHPWLRPSIELNRDDIRIIIRGAIDSTLARAAKGRSMADPGFALQRAIYQRLSAELTVPVFDAVPDDTLYPYVTIDREVAQNTSPISGRKRKQRLIYLSVWSDHHDRPRSAASSRDRCGAGRASPLSTKGARCRSGLSRRTPTANRTVGPTWVPLRYASSPLPEMYQPGATGGTHGRQSQHRRWLPNLDRHQESHRPPRPSTKLMCTSKSAKSRTWASSAIPSAT